jgi:hypothetical protein
MSERAAYSRVYWSVVDDEKFATIYDDDHHLATWLRLLLVADQSHPASANVPSGTRRQSVAALSSAGLIDLGSGSRFRIHGLDAERERRRIAATSRGDRPPTGRGPNGNQTVTKSDPTGIQTPGLRRDEGETSLDETDARATDDRWDAPEQEALVWLSRHGCDVRPGNGYHQKLITAVEVHGVNAIVGMFDRLAGAGTANGDVKGFLFGAIDALNAQTRPNLRALESEDAGEREAVSVRRRVENTQRMLHENGHHQDSPSPNCPLCKAVTA